MDLAATAADPLAARTLLLVAVVTTVLVAGLLWRAVERRRRRAGFAAEVAGTTTVHLDATVLGERPGELASVVVVGTRGCSDCARTLAVLRAGLATRDGVAVAHVLAEHQPGLVEALNVRTAPTVLLADRADLGAPVRATHPGAVDLDVVVAALDDLAEGRAPVLAQRPGQAA